MVSLRCCAMQFRKWRASLRVITVFIFLAIFAYDANWNVLTFSRTSGVPVTPWVYPAVFSDRYLMMCICLAVMVLFCDAPFLDRHQPYLILRSGRRPGRLCRRHIPPGHSLPPGPNHPPGHGGQLRRWKNRHQSARWEKPGRRILFPPPGAVRYRHTLHPAACRVSGGVWGNHQICSPHRSAFDRPGAGGHQPPHPGDHCPLCGSQGEPGASR